MDLLHTIAVEPNFKLQVHQNEDSMYCRIKQTMHDCFWDIFTKEISETPPNLSQAPSLLRDLKSVMASNCAPERDGLVEGLANFKHNPALLLRLNWVLEHLRNLFEVLTILKMDVANFNITTLRPYLVQNAISYEQQKFLKLIENCKVDLCYTKIWLSEAFKQCGDTQSISILNCAYVSLLDVSLRTEFTYPEVEMWLISKTLILDVDRIFDISNKVLKLCFFATIVESINHSSNENKTANIISGFFESFGSRWSFGGMRKNPQDTVSSIRQIFESVDCVSLDEELLKNVLTDHTCGCFSQLCLLCGFDL
ncbi:T-complex protein 11-like protein 2 [Octopus sinensis]|uniref:T-complex protein 11-like protein 2 n=1 Tax=Octopus sinensis TaxID=2607531 RepID=A0A6P7TUS4_9MOLL|nr:T-complex protein 11-like protein 2 [Octopus sinensis]